MLGKFFLWLSSTKAWKWFASNIIAKIRFKFSGYTDFPIEKYFEIVKLIEQARQNKEGLVVFASADKSSLAYKLIRLVTGGDKHTHAGIILMKEGNAFTLHMKGDGVHYEPLFKLFKESDIVTIKNIPLLSSKKGLVYDRIKFVIDNKDQIAYDFEQQLNKDGINPNSKIYCSELIYLVTEDALTLPTEYILGREAITPETVAKAGELIFTNLKD